MTDIYPSEDDVTPRRRRAQFNWLLTMLPAFPLVLLVLRLWYLSRQDLPTMLLLVQYISPLGMISALGITLIWSVPAIILVLRALGGILLVSAPKQAEHSLLAGTAKRMPDWVVLLAAGLAGLTWELRLLPVLLMLIVSIIGLTAVHRQTLHIQAEQQATAPERPVPEQPGPQGSGRQGSGQQGSGQPRAGRHHADRRERPRPEQWLMPWVTLGVPILVGALVLLFVWPGIRDAVAAGEHSTALLLGVPPLLGPLLTGPVPARAARFATHWPAVGAALVAPLIVGVLFLRAPVLPDSAVELGDPGKPVDGVVQGQLIAVDDTSTTVLEDGGEVTFIPNDRVRSKTLCREPDHGPDSVVLVRGWPAEDSALSWVAPVRPETEIDPRCLGRPLDPA